MNDLYNTIIKLIGSEIKKTLFEIYGDSVYSLLDPCSHCPHFDIDTFTCDNPDCEGEDNNGT